LGMGREVGRAARNAQPWRADETTMASVDGSDALLGHAHGVKVHGSRCRLEGRRGRNATMGSTEGPRTAQGQYLSDPTLSIVLCTRNRADSLRRSLARYENIAA